MNTSDTSQNIETPYRLVVSGRVEKTVTLTMDDLQTMDIVETDHLKMICGDGTVKRDLGSLSGVLLTDIINLSEVIAPEHNDTKKMYVAVTSGDGYKTLFAWQELYNSDNGEGVIVVLKKNGRPLYDHNESANLISAKDFLSGPRHVKDVRSIDIRILE